MEDEIPTQLDIACFRIDTEVVRTGLLKKKKSIVNGLLDQFAEKLRNQVQKVVSFHEYCVRNHRKLKIIILNPRYVMSTLTWNEN